MPLQRHGIEVNHYPTYVNTQINLHRVDVLLVSFIRQGEAEHVIGNDRFLQKSGSIAITYYGQLHDIITNDKGIIISNIFLNPEKVALPSLPGELDQLQHNLFPPFSGFGHYLNRSLHIPLLHPQSLEALVDRLAVEQTENRIESDRIIQNIKELILIECCQSARDRGIIHPVSQKQQLPVWMNTITLKFDKNYHQSFELDTLANQLGMSKSYLCRAFKKHSGKTLVEYLTQRRLQAAMHRLSSSKDKVLTIAIDCGFGDLSHFNKVFKKRIGQSPSSYRQHRQ